MCEYDINIIFDKWVNEIRTNYYEQRYTHAHRPKLVGLLAELFKGAGIEYVDAKFYLNKVMDILITDEGKKGKGKYKGWKEAVIQDYLSALAGVYVKDTTLEKSATENKMKPIDLGDKPETKQIEVDPLEYMENDNLIINWCQNKFKDEYTEELIKESHKVGSYLNVEFLNEVFGSQWMGTGQNIPDWINN